jgi:virginiamycin B lyase
MGLALGVLTLSAGASTAASSPTIPGSPVPAAAVTPSVSPPAAAASPPISTITPEATIAIPQPQSIVTDGSHLWVLQATGEVARIDPGTNTVGASATVDPTHQDGGLAVNQAGLWLSDFDANLVYRVDPASLVTVAKIASGPNPEGIAAGDDAVWVANHRGGTVARIDPATNTVVATITVGDAGRSGPHQVGLGLGSVWVGVPNASAVFRIDPMTNEVQAKIDYPSDASPCSGFAFSEQAVWTPSCFDTTRLVRIDPLTNKVVATIDLHGYGGDPILVDGFPWLTVASTTGGPARLVRIDPETNTIDKVVSLGDAFMDGNLVVADGSVWVADLPNDQVIRLPMAAFEQ